MQRRALLRRVAATAGLAGLAGCGGGDDDTGTTTTTTTATTRTEAPDPTRDPGSVTSTAPLIDSDMDALKLRLEDLPDDENWAAIGEFQNTTTFEHDVTNATYGFVLEATVAANEDLETAVTTYQDHLDRADSYIGITPSAVDVGVEAFGYQLTSDSATIVVRDANVVGELEYILDYDSTGDHSVGLGEAVGYAALWQATWR